MNDFFNGGNFYTGPKITPGMLRDAELKLGYRFPDSYKSLLYVKNGGCPTRSCFVTPFETYWSANCFEIKAIFGVGGKWGVDSDSNGSQQFIHEWGFPEIGIAVGLTATAGHDAVMLDYSVCGPLGEPSVAYVEADSEFPARTVAQTFQEFIDRLVLPFD